MVAQYGDEGAPGSLSITNYIKIKKPWAAFLRFRGFYFEIIEKGRWKMIRGLFLWNHIKKNQKKNDYTRSKGGENDKRIDYKCDQGEEFVRN